ncbi:MAG TPA: transporter [Clostridiales bacterium]|nr:transporter [Clostridiales bacterium]
MDRRGEKMNKSIIYLSYFAIYTLLLLFFGKSGFKVTNNARDYFVAGNSLGLASSIFSFCATWFSAASMQGVTGTVYAYGISTVLYSIVPWLLGAVLLMVMSGKIREYDIMTLPEFFYYRYDSRFLQALGGGAVSVIYTLYIVIQIRGFGIVMSELLDISYMFAIVLIYLFIIYTTFGGLYSVSKSHRLNFMLVVLGVVLAAFVVLKETGGIYSIYENSMMINTRPFPGFLHVTEEGGMVHLSAKGQMPPLLLFTSFFGWGLGLSSTPQYAIRIVAAKDDMTAKKMIFYSLIALILLYTGLVIIGMGGRTIIPSIDSIRSVDEVFPHLINNVLYSPLSGLIFIGIIAASISSADSQLLIASSGFTYDIYKNLINNSIDDDRFLNLNRAFIFAVGTAALLLAIKPPDSLLIYGGYIWGFFSSTFLIPLYGGLFWKKSEKEAAVASFAAGLLAFGVMMLRGGKDMIHPSFPGVIASAITFFSVSAFLNMKRRGVDEA